MLLCKYNELWLSSIEICGDKSEAVDAVEVFVVLALFAIFVGHGQTEETNDLMTFRHLESLVGAAIAGRQFCEADWSSSFSVCGHKLHAFYSFIICNVNNDFFDAVKTPVFDKAGSETIIFFIFDLEHR